MSRRRTQIHVACRYSPGAARGQELVGHGRFPGMAEVRGCQRCRRGGPGSTFRALESCSARMRHGRSATAHDSVGLFERAAEILEGVAGPPPVNARPFSRVVVEAGERTTEASRRDERLRSARPARSRFARRCRHGQRRAADAQFAVHCAGHLARGPPTASRLR